MTDAASQGPLAVIDLGSNSIRLVVYDALTRAPVSRLNERRLCGLGSEVARTGLLGREAKACALESLQRFVALARGMACRSIDIVATAALRDAADGAAFAAEAGRLIGLPITVLEGAEEALHGALGIACGFADPIGMMGDLGGGSVEFAPLPVGVAGRAGHMSLGLGALLVRERVEEGLEHAARFVDQQIEAEPRLAGACRGMTFYAVGGSWRGLARIRMALQDHPLRVVHGYEMTPDEALTLGRTIAGLDERALAQLPGVPRRRLDTLRGAALLLAAVVRRLEPARIVFSATGLREGRLFARLDPHERAKDPLLAGAAQLGATVHRLPGIGPAMAGWSEGILREETPAWRRLRHAVAYVSDTSWRGHPESRAREAFFHLLHYPLLGISHRERACLALALFVRYGGQPNHPAIRRVVGLLDEADRSAAQAVGEALELGYRLCGGVPAILEACHLHRDGDLLRLEVAHSAVARGDEAVKGRLRAVARALGLGRTAIVPQAA